jgi:endogenous inhibitor of DNA gyrase (YacG/DUF329 family)
MPDLIEHLHDDDIVAICPYCQDELTEDDGNTCPSCGEFVLWSSR